MSDFSKYKALEIARVASNADMTKGAANVTAGAVQVVSQSHQRMVLVPVLANAIAALANTALAQVPYAGHFASANVVISAAQVANATDYNVYTIYKQTGAGALVVVATANLLSVAVAANVPVAFTIPNAANAVLAQGDVLIYGVTKTGNGIANASFGLLACVIEDDS